MRMLSQGVITTKLPGQHPVSCESTSQLDYNLERKVCRDRKLHVDVTIHCLNCGPLAESFGNCWAVPGWPKLISACCRIPACCFLLFYSCDWLAESVALEPTFAKFGGHNKPQDRILKSLFNCGLEFWFAASVSPIVIAILNLNRTSQQNTVKKSALSVIYNCGLYSCHSLLF